MIDFLLISFQIQKMVISGGHFKPEALKPKEVVSLLLDDAELECKCKLALRTNIVIRSVI